MRKGLLTISVVMIMLLSLLIAGCDSFGSVPEEPTPLPEPEPTPTVTPEPTPEPVVNELEEIEDEEEEEEVKEVVEAEPDEPPFLTTLRTGVYGYEMHMVASRDDATLEEDSFVYSNGSVMAFGLTDDSGEVIKRYIYDYEKNRIYGIFDETKAYNFQDDIDFFRIYGIPDFYSGLEQSGKGTTEFEGETFD